MKFTNRLAKLEARQEQWPQAKERASVRWLAVMRFVASCLAKRLDAIPPSHVALHEDFLEACQVLEHYLACTPVHGLPFTEDHCSGRLCVPMLEDGSSAIAHGHEAATLRYCDWRDRTAAGLIRPGEVVPRLDWAWSRAYPADAPETANNSE